MRAKTIAPKRTSRKKKKAYPQEELGNFEDKKEDSRKNKKKIIRFVNKTFIFCLFKKGIFLSSIFFFEGEFLEPTLETFFTIHFYLRNTF